MEKPTRTAGEGVKRQLDSLFALHCDEIVHDTDWREIVFTIRRNNGKFYLAEFSKRSVTEIGKIG